MRNAALKFSFGTTAETIYAHATLSFTEQDLERAGRILDRVKRLESPARESEFVRLVLEQAESAATRYQ